MSQLDGKLGGGEEIVITCNVCFFSFYWVQPININNEWNSASYKINIEIFICNKESVWGINIKEWY